MNIQSFWERVNALIKEQKKTQRGISLQCGFTERRVETLVSTGRSPDVLEAAKIAQALGTSVEYLVTGKEPDTSRKYIDRLEAIRFLANQPL